MSKKNKTRVFAENNMLLWICLISSALFLGLYALIDIFVENYPTWLGLVLFGAIALFMLVVYIVYKKKLRLTETAALSLYTDKIVIGESTLSFDEISSFAVLGRNKLNLYYNKKVYQIRGGKRFNALKYVNIFQRYNNVKKGEENVEFLGL